MASLAIDQFRVCPRDMVARRGVLEEDLSVTETNGKFSRRQFLAYQSIIDGGATEEQAAATFASAARDHPEWDWDEKMTWAEWEARRPRGRRTTGAPEPS